MVSGNQATGKTNTTAITLVDYKLTYPKRLFIALDSSAALTNEFIELYHSIAVDQKAQIDQRFVLDIPGDEELV